MSTDEVVKDEDTLLAEARERAGKAATLLKNALKDGKLKDGLKHANTMLSELRTTDLPPQLYGALCKESIDCAA